MGSLMCCASELPGRTMAEVTVLIVPIIVLGPRLRVYILTLIFFLFLLAMAFPSLLVTFLSSRLARLLWVGLTVLALHGRRKSILPCLWFAVVMYSLTVSSSFLPSIYVYSWVFLSHTNVTILCLLRHLWYSETLNLAFLHPTWPFLTFFNYPHLSQCGHNSYAEWTGAVHGSRTSQDCLPKSLLTRTSR